MIKILTLTSLFPNAVQPAHGIFVRQRLRHLAGHHDVDIRIVAPVPWYPYYLPGPDRYTMYRSIPDVETLDGFKVSHPRYPVLPRIGMSSAPSLMAAAIIGCVRKIVSSERHFDLIDAHYFYPDGVAAAWIARKLGLPLVITARGTDINLIPKYSIPRRQILWAARHASAIISVCDALRDEMIDLGVAHAKITTLRNGYEPSVFHPVDRGIARADLGISGKTLLSVGHLIERKGHHIVIDALSKLPDFNLIIVGAGDMEQDLRRQVEHLGLQNRIRFEGVVEQAKLKMYYSACDALTLASSREGMANVLIESIACGCPVVATNSWGTPEVVKSPAAGVLVDGRSASAIEDGVRRLFLDYPDRVNTIEYAKQYHWEPTSQGQFDIFEKVVKPVLAASPRT